MSLLTSLVAQVMARIGASGGSSRVSLVEADVAFKAFRDSGSPSSPRSSGSPSSPRSSLSRASAPVQQERDRSSSQWLQATEGDRSSSQSLEPEGELDEDQLLMRITCDEAELLALSTQAALEV